MITANQSESWLEDSSDFQDLLISCYNKTFILTNLKFIFAFTYFARKSFRSEQSRANERLIRLVPNRQLRYKINTICPLSNSCPLLRQLVVKKKLQNWVTPWPKQKFLRYNVPLPAWVTSKGEHFDDVKESSKAAMGMGRRKRSADLENHCYASREKSRRQSSLTSRSELTTCKTSRTDNSPRAMLTIFVAVLVSEAITIYRKNSNRLSQLERGLGKRWAADALSRQAFLRDK